ncbi:hypothetical protein KCP75_05005 [Salmonella enterica subsp. enterica]|nr:hypothetical protein KCP75_05005 [Salmonella enterica subsp. enterica]
MISGRAGRRRSKDLPVHFIYESMRADSGQSPDGGVVDHQNRAVGLAEGVHHLTMRKTVIMRRFLRLTFQKANFPGKRRRDRFISWVRGFALSIYLCVMSRAQIAHLGGTCIGSSEREQIWSGS